jgi:hypothetical protein
MRIFSYLLVYFCVHTSLHISRLCLHFCLSLAFFASAAAADTPVALQDDTLQLPPKKAAPLSLHSGSPMSDASAAWKGYDAQHPKCSLLASFVLCFCHLCVLFVISMFYLSSQCFARDPLNTTSHVLMPLVGLFV